ncbi:hypothetical protein [Blastococcus brunescens]|uniref:MmgE/PrpD C-terminal domain-containing protein n=1 Tax=Blastococcus brunescens TaxID=1564165 RepID=A0ABZ1AZN7_9ACTN|nr:hypothetical protein [Blastococcus sp. BMG 8361]WRL63602.1 hypothetical protein U6N30_28645 [Blastococcus sp. BMG 8361]
MGSVRADEVVEVVVHVNPGSDNSLIHPYATTPAQARFCMRYVVAAALLDGRVDFATFSPDRVLAEDVQALMRKVRLEHDAEVPYGVGATASTTQRSSSSARAVLRRSTASARCHAATRTGRWTTTSWSRRPMPAWLTAASGPAVASS